MVLVIVVAADVVSVCLAALVLGRRHPLWGRRRLPDGLLEWRQSGPRVDLGFEHRPWTDKDSAFAQLEYGRRGRDGIPGIALIAPHWSMN
jgi:hypothetical protein